VNLSGLGLIIAGWLLGTVGVVAQATGGSGGSDPIAQLTGYGALGLVVLGAIIGQIRFKPEVTAMREDMLSQSKTSSVERERMQTQIDTLLDVHRTQVLPALLSSAEALRTSAEQMQQMATQIALLTDMIRERR
jgi:hypothetical protein